VNNITLILDSSVIAKWFFPEKDSEKALLIKEKFVNNDISIAIPLLLYYEVNNILRTAVKTYRIDVKDAIDVYNAFLKLDFIVYSSRLLMTNTLETALKFDISSYDASYIALSEYLKAHFLTADQKLLQKVPNTSAVNIKDYAP
jgi:predicted nucleic acid-binding protein